MTGESQPSSSSLRDLGSHFAFGENWAKYAELIDEERLAEADRGLVRLLGADCVRGRTFLDIGCGSGLHAAAAARLGASRVLALDIDPVSVETTRAVLRRHGKGANAEAKELNVFDLDPDSIGPFDIVYSWGVLHHTGAMHDAVRMAAQLVAPGGTFAFALYRKTRLCWFWTREKRWYSTATPRAQQAARSIYIGLMRLALRRRFRDHVANYKSARGMDYYHDVHDWMGGYPYESTSADEIDALMRPLGFEHLKSFTLPLSHGLFGAGCDEYVYRRVTP
ncbi:bifunctional 2-polyprenyl-6-hydroxyphenol methylase/3-demethylubiquinol 3-O-methyltransferase UbiG [Mycobacterium sp. URHB0044]|uniref:class I SAM-dependent methyltransferase n=1 Tax=Mycobacterium sp. URHB0044 TaxID=1380386 RepID=UPI000688BDC6|nr:class I SAM-dependent methyltransferase [Mycobacterium sp. URHB0044]